MSRSSLRSNDTGLVGAYADLAGVASGPAPDGRGRSQTIGSVSLTKRMMDRASVSGKKRRQKIRQLTQSRRIPAYRQTPWRATVLMLPQGPAGERFRKSQPPSPPKLYLKPGRLPFLGEWSRGRANPGRFSLRGLTHRSSPPISPAFFISIARTTGMSETALNDIVAEAHPFQAEVAKLLGLMVHSVYSDCDIFLRELISNAADALDKLRYEAIAKPELTAVDPE